MNIIYFAMKKLNENRAFLAMLGFLLVFSCSKDKKEGNGDATKYTLSITKPTNGKLVSKPGNIDCGGEGNDCKAEFSKDSKVTLTATADTGYILGAWQGACDKTKADQPCKLSMNANKTAGKAFLARPTLNIDPKPIYGTLTSDVGDINCGSEGDDCEAEFDKVVEVTLTAMANTGYILGDWQGNCSETGIEEETCQLSMDANKTAGRAFLARPTLSIDPKPIYGTLTSDVGNINCGSEGDDCEAEFDRVVEVTLTAAADTGYALAAWQGACDETATGQACQLSMDANKTAGLLFIDADVDDDNDGLIEIHDLDMFNHIQYSLAGTSYKMGADAEANIRGAPASQTDNCKTATNGVYLCGYELMGDLDFAQDSSYAGGSVNTDWQPTGGDADSAVNEGFVGATNFAGIFEGNGNSITNLYSRGGGSGGLFRATTSAASIRNLGVANANLYSSAVDQNLGTLVGTNNGTIIASSATGGTVNGGDGTDSVGGLVSYNSGSIGASYATGAVNGGDGTDSVGGLVGSNWGNIIASYATGVVNGGGGDDDHVGGLVGDNGSIVIASYATGAANGDGGGDSVGGLVGDNGSIVIASYATGDVDGGSESDIVGGLVGYMQTATIIASYATGATSNGTHAGDLIGSDLANLSTITKSYGFGSGMKVGGGKDGDAHPSGVTDATDLTSGSSGTGAGSEWDDASEKTKGAWDFGTGSQNPALKYADYDDAGVDFSCDMFPPKIPGTDTNLVCDTTPLPGQGR